MPSLRKKLDSPLTVAITGSALQALVWVNVAVLIAEAHTRHVTEPSTPTGEFYSYVYGNLFFGGSLSIIGFLVSIDAAVRKKYRGRWFFWVSILLSLLLSILFPIGTVLGLGFVVYLAIVHKEFGVGPESDS